MKLAVLLLLAACSAAFAQTNLPATSTGLATAPSTNKPNLKELMKNRSFTNSIGMVMVKVGSSWWAGKYLVTGPEYEKVMGVNPGKFAGALQPADSVSWNDAVAFCARLTALEKQKEFLPEGFSYTLPTQSQWETLAAGTPLSQAVTSQAAKRNSTAPVDSLSANRLGLHDVRGNLWQWCLDPSDKPFRVLRGGAWNTSIEMNLRPEFRWYSNGPDERKDIFGFRCILQQGK